MMIDTLGMFDAAFDLPEQIERAAETTRATPGIPPADGATSIVVLGMGGSGIAGDVVSAIARPSCSIPVVVSKQYECPAFVGPDTIVFAVSFSGDTEETIAAAHQAVGAGARLVVVAAGGHLERIAHEWGAPVIPVDPAIPMPRAAMGAVSVPPLLALERMGLIDGVSGQVEHTIEQLRIRRDELASPNSSAAKLARKIGRTLPIVYGGAAIGEVAAWRWKTQFNENPKVAAFANRVPELTHNEVCGWGQHGDVTRQVFSLVLLRHGFEHGQEQRRFDLVAEVCDEVVAGVHQVRAEGAGPLAQLFDLVFVGDLVSLHMAANEELDPGPVPVLDEIKTRLRMN